MDNKYLIRRVQNQTDINKLIILLNNVFQPERVGNLAKIFLESLPESECKYWFIAEEKETKNIVSSFTLIPWCWELKGIKLKVAEMGLVATDVNHRGKGLMRLLNQEFDAVLKEEEFDLAVIQGIPGFYHKFGYHYAIPMENHLNICLKNIPSQAKTRRFEIRNAEISDIPFLISEDKSYRDANYISVFRNTNTWEYILRQGRKTEYGSDVIILEFEQEKFYCRILFQGFGKGLIVSEVSNSISEESFMFLLTYLKNRAIIENKAFIRFNVGLDSRLGEMLLSAGVQKSKPYAWQVKIPDKINFLNKLKPVLESRIGNSEFYDFSKILRLDFYSETIDVIFKNGKITEFLRNIKNEPDFSFNIPVDLFASLILGHRNWVELQENRPDIASMLLYIDPEEKPMDDISGKLIDILFPKQKSWINLQY
ncbi:MAG: GNAT family N-acetyltransferase [Bacteroidales bacterium]|nr:GNAT family N-acetyltransferase [Bacteroidales bacterium]